MKLLLVEPYEEMFSTITSLFELADIGFPKEIVRTKSVREANQVLKGGGISPTVCVADFQLSGENETSLYELSLRLPQETALILFSIWPPHLNTEYLKARSVVWVDRPNFTRLFEVLGRF